MTLGTVTTGMPTFVLGGDAVNSQTHSVLRTVSQYSNKATLCGASVASHRSGKRSPHTVILAEVTDNEKLMQFYENSSAILSVSGNGYSLKENGQLYTVRNLPPEKYAEAIETLDTGEHILFSHDGLQEQAANVSKDPGFNHSITPVPERHPTPATAEDSFAAWFDAMIAAEAYGLTMSSEASGCGATICQFPVNDATVARDVVDSVVERVAYASEVLEQDSLRRLLSSPLVDNSFQMARGVSSARIVSMFPSIRRSLSGQSNSSVWLALTLGSVADGGSLHKALTSEHVLYADSTRAALDGATRILRSGTLKSLGLESTGQVEEERSTTIAAGPMQAELLASAGDLDGDGVPSLVEYALGSDPLDPMSQPNPRISNELEENKRYLTLTYEKNTLLSEIDYKAQASTDLKSGNWSAEGVEDQLVSSANGIEVRKARIAMTRAQQYMRVLVSLK